MKLKTKTKEDIDINNLKITMKNVVAAAEKCKTQKGSNLNFQTA